MFNNCILIGHYRNSMDFLTNHICIKYCNSGNTNTFIVIVFNVLNNLLYSGFCSNNEHRTLSALTKSVSIKISPQNASTNITQGKINNPRQK